jgi:hypothetical protein
MNEEEAGGTEDRDEIVALEVLYVESLSGPPQVWLIFPEQG